MGEAVIHPRIEYDHYSYYLEGLERSGYRLRFRRLDVPAGFDGKMALETDGKRIVVAAGDHATVDPEHVGWADVYGQVNLTEPTVGVTPLGPTFGVRRPHPFAERARLKAAGHRGKLTSWDRVPVDAYVPGGSDPGYLFFAAWPWSKHPEVNPARRAYIEAARAVPGVRFEGGFAPYRRGPAPGFEDVSARRKYPVRTYLENVRRSAVVFNNPAVHGCLGWKLGEFLALGKAIITLPLGRHLPAPLVHGEHVHVVRDPPGIPEALRVVLGDPGYRARLERNARAWYEEWLTPERVVGRLLSQASTRPSRNCGPSPRSASG